MEDSLSRIVNANAAPPPFDTLRFTSTLTRIRSVTVINQSQLSIGLYPGMASPQGVPAITIGPMQQTTVPINNSGQVAVKYLGQSATNGFVYLHYSDEYIAPSNSVLNTLTQSTIFGISFTLGYAAGSLNNVPLFPLEVAETPSIHLAGLPQFSSSIAIAHIILESTQSLGFYSIQGNNNDSGIGPEFHLYMNATSIDYDFSGSPFPLWYVGIDKIGDRIMLGLDGTAAAAGQATITLLLQLT